MLGQLPGKVRDWFRRWLFNPVQAAWRSVRERESHKRGWSRARSWTRQNYLLPLFLLAAALTPFWLVLLAKIVSSLMDQLALEIPADPDEKRAHFYAIGLTITGLGAALAPPFVLIKAFVNERTATAAEQGLITTRITQAVEQLGAEKTVHVRSRPVRFEYEDAGETKIGHTVEYYGETLGLWPGARRIEEEAEQPLLPGEATRPNLEVRLGAIYALERIAQDSPRDHPQIMEILCAYIRENAPAKSAVPNPLPEWEPLPDDADDEARKAHEAARKERFGRFYIQSKAFDWARSLPQPRADIQAALTVLGRRGEDAIRHETKPLDLRSTNLQRADLSGLTLGRALLSGARMEGADLRGARMEGANLYEARMEGTNLYEARMEGANLRGARMEGALLSGTDLKSTDLRAESPTSNFN